MRNFDEERTERLGRDTSFTIAGRTFDIQSNLRPEDFSAKISPYLKSVGETVTAEETIKLLDQTIEGFLLPEYIESWREARQIEGGDTAESIAITAADMRAIIVFIFEQQTGHPTEEEPSSGNGSAIRRTPRRSTGRSSSAVVVSEE
jgi:hypothetical protein